MEDWMFKTFDPFKGGKKKESNTTRVPNGTSVGIPQRSRVTEI
jgi:hypothetical protein